MFIDKSAAGGDIPVGPVDPVDPVDSVDPVDPVEPVDPVVPVDPSNNKTEMLPHPVCTPPFSLL